MRMIMFSRIISGQLSIEVTHGGAVTERHIFGNLADYTAWMEKRWTIGHGLFGDATEREAAEEGE